MEEKKNSMNIDDLAALIQEGFNAMDKRLRIIEVGQRELEVRMSKLDLRVVRLEVNIEHQFEERTFELEEKEELLAAATAFNQQLEDSALGKENITFTRPEYDVTAVIADFPNRFAAPALAE